jgi:hypothetical protein
LVSACGLRVDRHNAGWLPECLGEGSENQPGLVSGNPVRGSAGGDIKSRYSSFTSFAPNIAKVDYVGGGLTVSIIYTLVGGTGGSGNSDVAETISVKNTSGSAMDLHFFQYADFDLGGTSSDDRLAFSNANAVRQRDLGGTLALSETVATPAPDHHAGDTFPNLYNSFFDTLPTTLNDLPAIGGGSLDGDVTWGFQWDRNLANNASFLISKDKNLSAVPEPATLVLLGAGLLGTEAARRRRRKV